MPVANLRQFLGIITLNAFWITFQAHTILALLSGLWWHKCYIFCYRLTGPWGLVLFLYFSLFFCFSCCTLYSIFRFTYSFFFLKLVKILFYSFFSFYCWVHSLNLKISVMYFSVLKFPFESSSHFHFHCWDSFYIGFRCILNCLLKCFIMAPLISLSDNSNIYVISVLASDDSLFSFKLKFFRVLGMISNFLSYPEHFWQASTNTRQAGVQSGLSLHLA